MQIEREFILNPLENINQKILKFIGQICRINGFHLLFRVFFNDFHILFYSPETTGSSFFNQGIFGIDKIVGIPGFQDPRISRSQDFKIPGFQDPRINSFIIIIISLTSTFFQD